MAIANRWHRVMHLPIKAMYVPCAWRSDIGKSGEEEQEEATEKRKNLQGTDTPRLKRHAFEKNAKASALASRLAESLRQAPMNKRRGQHARQRQRIVSTNRLRRTLQRLAALPFHAASPANRSMRVDASSRICTRVSRAHFPPDRRSQEARRTPTAL